MRLIDADRLKRQVEGRSWRAKERFIELIDASATIKSQTVQVRFGVKHGRWIEYNYPGHEHVYCSNCKKEYYVDDLLMGRNDYPAFCPHCGAQMDLEGEDHEQD